MTVDRRALAKALNLKIAKINKIEDDVLKAKQKADEALTEAKKPRTK